MHVGADWRSLLKESKKKMARMPLVLDEEHYFLPCSAQSKNLQLKIGVWKAYRKPASVGWSGSEGCFDSDGCFVACLFSHG